MFVFRGEVEREETSGNTARIHHVAEWSFIKPLSVEELEIILGPREFKWSETGSEDNTTWTVTLGPTPEFREKDLVNLLNQQPHDADGPWQGALNADDIETTKDQSLSDWPKLLKACLLYTSPSPRDATLSRMPSSA